jgi:hypothetical protein
MSIRPLPVIAFITMIVAIIVGKSFINKGYRSLEDATQYGREFTYGFDSSNKYTFLTGGFLIFICVMFAIFDFSDSSLYWLVASAVYFLACITSIKVQGSKLISESKKIGLPKQFTKNYLIGRSILETGFYFFFYSVIPLMIPR